MREFTRCYYVCIEKIYRLLFTKLSRWNPKYIASTALHHYSLNFHPSYTLLREKGQSVTQNYQQEIGKLIKMWLKRNPNKVEWISIYIYIYTAFIQYNIFTRLKANQYSILVSTVTSFLMSNQPFTKPLVFGLSLIFTKPLVPTSIQGHYIQFLC